MKIELVHLYAMRYTNTSENSDKVWAICERTYTDYYGTQLEQIRCWGKRVHDNLQIHSKIMLPTSVPRNAASFASEKEDNGYWFVDWTKYNNIWLALRPFIPEIVWGKSSNMGIYTSPFFYNYQPSSNDKTACVCPMCGKNYKNQIISHVTKW